MLLKQCLEAKESCDDQVVLNRMLACSYKIKSVGNTAYSNRYNYTSSVFNRTFVSRSEVINCKSWISMPFAKKKGTSRSQNCKLYNDKFVHSIV